MANGRRVETGQSTVVAEIELIAEVPGGVVYHDRAAGEWALDLIQRGTLLAFTAEEFRSLLRLARAALRHPDARALLGGRDAEADARGARGRRAA